MAQVEYIKDLYENQGLSLREISRRLNISFRTVQKYAQRLDWSKTRHTKASPEQYPILAEYIGYIEDILETDQKLPRKQRHTAKRIYDRLCAEQGFTGSYSSVRRYVSKRKGELHTERNAGYLPLEHPMGHAQVDFGEFLYHDTEGKDKKGYALTMVFPYSNKGYNLAFPSQNQECLLQGMQQIFEYIGGVPIRIRFDNMSTAVVKVLTGPERELTDGFRRFMLHYRFQADFCNPASGNEKGTVENKVGYCRRNMFVPVPTIRSFEDYNRTLLEWCEQDALREHYVQKRPIRELFAEEQGTLLTLPESDFPVCRYETIIVDKCGFARFETNKYSLLPSLQGKLVQAKIFFDRVIFFYDGRQIAEYNRSYGRDEEIYDWTKYIFTLYRKPRALEQTRFFECFPPVWKEHLRNTEGKDRKDALGLLGEIVNDGNADICDDILSLARDNGTTDIDSLRQCYYLLMKKENRPEPLQLSTETPLLNYSPDLSAYDGLTGGAQYA